MARAIAKPIANIESWTLSDWLAADDQQTWAALVEYGVENVMQIGMAVAVMQGVRTVFQVFGTPDADRAEVETACGQLENTLRRHVHGVARWPRITQDRQSGQAMVQWEPELENDLPALFTEVMVQLLDVLDEAGPDTILVCTQCKRLSLKTRVAQRYCSSGCRQMAHAKRKEQNT